MAHRLGLLTAYITGMIRQVNPLTLETIMMMVKGAMQIPGSCFPRVFSMSYSTFQAFWGPRSSHCNQLVTDDRYDSPIKPALKHKSTNLTHESAFIQSFFTHTLGSFSSCMCRKPNSTRPSWRGPNQKRLQVLSLTSQEFEPKDSRSCWFSHSLP